MKYLSQVLFMVMLCSTDLWAMSEEKEEDQKPTTLLSRLTLENKSDFSIMVGRSTFIEPNMREVFEDQLIERKEKAYPIRVKGDDKVTFTLQRSGQDPLTNFECCYSVAGEKRTYTFTSNVNFPKQKINVSLEFSSSF